jgi:hypothetical protein
VNVLFHEICGVSTRESSDGRWLVRLQRAPANARYFAMVIGCTAAALRLPCAPLFRRSAKHPLYAFPMKS